MSTATISDRLVPEDLLELNGNFEFVNGAVEQRNVSVESSRVALRIGRTLLNFAEERGLGEVYGSDLLVRAFADRTEVRRPDVAFISADRVPREAGFCLLAPDLVVEVVSPNDSAYSVRAKVDTWLDSGVRMVWIAWPEQREVQVYRQGARPETLADEDSLSGYDVIPGFDAPVASLFGPVRAEA